MVGQLQRKAAGSSPASGAHWTQLEGAPRPLQRRGGAEGAQGDTHAIAAQGLSGQGGALPHSAAIQQSFGSAFDVGQITAHTGGEAQAANDALGSKGYASGSDVALKSTDLFTAAHEAAHISQQAQGVSLSGGVGAEGDAYEVHADKVASAVVAGESAEGLLKAGPGGGGASEGVQLKRSSSAPIQFDKTGTEEPSSQPEVAPTTETTVVEEEAPSGDPGSLSDLWAMAPGTIQGLYPGDEKGNPAPHSNARKPHNALFHGDWFYAQDILLNGKFPDKTAQEQTGKKSTLEAMMRGLHGLRKRDTDATLASVRESLKSEPSIIAKLGESPPDKKVLDWAAAGSETLTSDIDVNLKGAGSIKAVGLFNEQFKSKGGWAKEAGTVFDVNVYAKDFMEDWPPFDLVDKDTKKQVSGDESAGKDISMVPHQEVELGSDDFAKFSADQDMWSFVKMRIYMTGNEWAAYVEQQLQDAPTEAQAELRKTLDAAEGQYYLYAFEIEAQTIAMERAATTTYKSLFDALKAGKEAAEVTVGEEQAQEQMEAALKMRAANMIYEEKLVRVQKLRDELESLKAMEPSAREALDRTIGVVGLELKQALSEAITFSNEAYFTQGSVHFAVLGKQVGGKMAKKKGMKSLEIDLPPDMLFHSVNENVGFTLEKLNHYGDLPNSKAWKGAAKAGKYIDRMMDSAARLPGVDTSEGSFVMMLNLGHKAAELKEAGANDTVTETEVKKIIGTKGIGDIRAMILALAGTIGTAYAKNKPTGQSLEDHTDPEEEPTTPEVTPVPSSGPIGVLQTQIQTSVSTAIVSMEQINAFLDRIPTSPKKG